MFVFKREQFLNLFVRLNRQLAQTALSISSNLLEAKEVLFGSLFTIKNAIKKASVTRLCCCWLFPIHMYDFYRVRVFEMIHKVSLKNFHGILGSMINFLDRKLEKSCGIRSWSSKHIEKGQRPDINILIFSFFLQRSLNLIY